VTAGDAAGPNDLTGLIPSDSYLEEAFLRWVLSAAARPAIAPQVTPQEAVAVSGRSYRVDYVLRGAGQPIAVELDGFAYHGNRDAFTYDRLRQNDLTAAGYQILRFSYEAIRTDTERCVAQVQAVCAEDAVFAPLLRIPPVVAVPDMPVGFGTSPLVFVAKEQGVQVSSYFNSVRGRVDLRTLRDCQKEAFAALSNYYGRGGARAATVMSVGAGKTALGVTASLAFARRRALIVTPGGVIRGTFQKALDPEVPDNCLYGLPSGPLIPGSKPPVTLTLDADQEPIKHISRDRILAADIIVTNFHSLGDGSDPDHLLAKLQSDDVDFIVVDEAHIAAADSYQRLFAHFANARTLLMSACFQRLAGVSRLTD